VITPDEHVILYENVGKLYTVEELKRLADCGLKTMMVWQFWPHIEPRIGEYDWSKVEDAINRSGKAGLKLVMCIPASAPTCYPPSWYLRCADGEILNSATAEKLNKSGFSYWHKEAMAYRDHFTEMVCRKYASERVLCASSFMFEGEYFLPSPAECKPAVCDDAAVASLKEYLANFGIPYESRVDRIVWIKTIQWLHQTFKDFALRTQKIYANFNPGKELWQQLHWAFSPHPACGTEILLPLYLETQQATGCEVNQLFCTGYDFPLDNPRSFMQRGMKNIWLGACWAEGLRKNTPSAIQNGLRGLFCAALHPYLPFKRMEEWQFENFKWAIQQWREHEK
jgi:hypothetical protein